MAQSILRSGQAQAILVAEMEDGRHIVVDGWTRRSASELLANDENLPPEKREEYQTIEAVVRRNLSMQDIASLSFVANEQRNDLFDMDRAISFTKALDDHLFQTQDELATAYGIDQSVVSRMKGMVEAPEPIKDLLVTHPDKLTCSFFAEINTNGLDLTLQRNLLLDVVSSNRTVPWLRTRVSGYKCVTTSPKTTERQENLDAALLKWSSTNRARSVEVILQSKAEQLEAIELLSLLFDLSRDNRAQLTGLLKNQKTLDFSLFQKLGDKR